MVLNNISRMESLEKSQIFLDHDSQLQFVKTSIFERFFNFFENFWNDQEIKEVQERSYEHILERFSKREETFILLK
jgi:hypothetical protein